MGKQEKANTSRVQQGVAPLLGEKVSKQAMRRYIYKGEGEAEPGLIVNLTRAC